MPDIFEDKPDPQGGDNQAKATAAEMKAFIERIERLEEDKASISEDIKTVWDEAKAKGYDTKAMRKLMSIKKMKPGEREMVRFYGDTLGIFG